MSRKKEQALQEFLTNDEDFEAAINTSGALYVIDSYPKWTGACKSICSTLKRIKLEVSSPRLKFATACIDEIDALHEYRDMPPEPIFTFYAGGVLVDICHGCNVPLLASKIQKQLDNEDKIEEGTQERKAYVVDRPGTAVSHTTLVDGDASLTAVGNSNAKQLTFAFITPIYIQHAEAIKAGFEAQGMEVLAERQHTIQKDELIHILPDILDERKFLSGDMFIEYITSATSILFILTREGEHGIGVIDQTLKFIGPSDQDTARIEAPDSANALYGNTCMWAATDADMANRAINLLFEGFGAPTISERASAVNTAASQSGLIYSVFGPCSEEFQVQLQNYGCSVVQDAAEAAAENLENVPEEMREHAQKMMVISCAKSLASIRAFCESSGEQGVFVLERPSSAASASQSACGELAASETNVAEPAVEESAEPSASGASLVQE